MQQNILAVLCDITEIVMLKLRSMFSYFATFICDIGAVMDRVSSGAQVKGFPRLSAGRRISTLSTMNVNQG